jgi:hypothetical protein
MRPRYAPIFLAVVGVLFTTYPAGAIHLLDVLFLSDGTSFVGIIMAEEPGKSVTLETEDGELLEYRLKDIQRIEKKLLDEQPLIENRDVVYLKDGVIFRGMIVGRVPGKEITLELENGQLLDFPMGEVAKIGKEQVATGVVKKGTLKPKSAEKERVETQIQIALGRLEAKREQQKAGEPAEGEGLQEEIDRLQEEMEQLQEQQQEAEAAATEEAERFAAVESEIGELRSQVLAAAEELKGRIAACGSATAKQQLEAAYRDLQRNIDEVMQRAEVIALVEQPDPRIVQIQLEQKTTSGTAIAQSRLWKDPRYAEQWQALVAELPYEQRREIYREAKSTGAVGRALVNAIPFGGFLGSWRKRDPAAAVTAGLIVGGLGVWIYEGSTPAGDETLLSVGGAMVLASWGFGIVEPFFHVLGQNMKLRDALELDRRATRTASGQGAEPLRGYEFPAPPPEPRIRLHLVRYEY